MRARFGRGLRRHAASGALLLAAALGVTGPARAQATADDKAAAELLYDDGKRLLEAGDFAAACDKFEKSQKLDAGVGTLLFLGDCYEKAGRVASAWATFREAAGAAKAAGQVDREEIARERARLLQPKLFRLTLDVSRVVDLPGLVIERNGKPIASGLLGEAAPLDRGAYRIDVSATGKKPRTITIDVPAEPGERTVVIDALEDAPAPIAAPPPPPVTAPPAAEGGMSGQAVAGLVVGGVGLAGLAVSGIFTGMALSKDSDADQHCDDSACRDQEGVDLATDAKDAAGVSTIAFVAGAALLATGGILYFTAPSSGGPTTGLRVTPVVSADAGGLFARGSF